MVVSKSLQLLPRNMTWSNECCTNARYFKTAFVNGMVSTSAVAQCGFLILQASASSTMSISLKLTCCRLAWSPRNVPPFFVHDTSTPVAERARLDTTWPRCWNQTERREGGERLLTPDNEGLNFCNRTVSLLPLSKLHTYKSAIAPLRMKTLFPKKLCYASRLQQPLW